VWGVALLPGRIGLLGGRCYRWRDSFSGYSFEYHESVRSASYPTTCQQLLRSSSVNANFNGNTRRDRQYCLLLSTTSLWLQEIDLLPAFTGTVFVYHNFTTYAHQEDNLPSTSLCRLYYPLICSLNVRCNLTTKPRVLSLFHRRTASMIAWACIFACADIESPRSPSQKRWRYRVYTCQGCPLLVQHPRWFVMPKRARPCLDRGKG
jgi:hypothetical protein